jgi:hypothetical protein
VKGDKIYYTDGWDYVLSRPYTTKTGIYPDRNINHRDEFILATDGTLTVFKGYPWDGATGAFDTKNAMRASLIHDCFCEMMRVGELDYDKYSPYVHYLLGDVGEEDGMSSVRASGWRKATKFFRGGHPSHPDPHPELSAP